MKLNANQVECMHHMVFTCIEGYKVAMACMLVVFVPQYNEGTFFDILLPKIFVKKLALIVNLMTLIMFCCVYIIESIRQVYFIQQLDVDHHIPDTHIRISLQSKPEIIEKIKALNLLYYRIILATFFVYFMNTMMSFSVIVYFHYNGITTLTNLVSSLLLVNGKLYYNYKILRKCIDPNSEVISLSTTLNEPLAYNILDHHYIC